MLVTIIASCLELAEGQIHVVFIQGLMWVTYCVCALGVRGWGRHDSQEAPVLVMEANSWPPCSSLVLQSFLRGTVLFAPPSHSRRHQWRVYLFPFYLWGNQVWKTHPLSWSVEKLEQRSRRLSDAKSPAPSSTPHCTSLGNSILETGRQEFQKASEESQTIRRNQKGSAVGNGVR